MRYRILSALHRLAGHLIDRLEEIDRRYLNTCPDCGRSRFYGEPCK